MNEFWEDFYEYLGLMIAAAFHWLFLCIPPLIVGIFICNHLWFEPLSVFTFWQVYWTFYLTPVVIMVFAFVCYIPVEWSKHKKLLQKEKADREDSELRSFIEMCKK